MSKAVLYCDEPISARTGVVSAAADASCPSGFELELTGILGIWSTIFVLGTELTQISVHSSLRLTSVGKYRAVVKLGETSITVLCFDGDELAVGSFGYNTEAIFPRVGFLGDFLTLSVALELPNGACWFKEWAAGIKSVYVSVKTLKTALAFEELEWGSPTSSRTTVSRFGFAAFCLSADLPPKNLGS